MRCSLILQGSKSDKPLKIVAATRGPNNWEWFPVGVTGVLIFLDDGQESWCRGGLHGVKGTCSLDATPTPPERLTSNHGQRRIHAVDR